MTPRDLVASATWEEATAMENFEARPAALDCIDTDGNTWTWVTGHLMFDSDGPDRDYIEVTSPVDARTFGIASVELDTADEARFTTEHGSRCIARAVRPYDAVPLGFSDQPLAVEAFIDDAVNLNPTFTTGPPTPLVFEASTVFVDDTAQRERAREFAEVVATDLQAAEQVPTWRRHVGATHIGWGPAKIPLRLSKVGLGNARFVTPTIAEALWRGERPAFRVEHVVARQLLADGWASTWETSGRDVDALAELVWRHRYGVVLTTPEEDAAISRASRIGGPERYVEAGITHVYDRLHRRDISVLWLDPDHANHESITRTLPHSRTPQW